MRRLGIAAVVLGAVALVAAGCGIVGGGGDTYAVTVYFPRAVSLFQSVTQIQEQTLSFVPKAIGVGVALLLSGNWMLHELISFTTGLYGQIPHLIGSA